MAPARFTGFIPWNRLSKIKTPAWRAAELWQSELRGAMLSVMRIEVYVKSNFREFLKNAWCAL
jgi:hypothetical protein